MRMIMRGTLAVAALLSYGSLDVAAQDAPRVRGPEMRGGAGVESVMSMRERLELTDEQIARLDGLRAEAVQERNELRSAMEEMRSQLRAGQIRRSEFMAFLEERGDQRAGRLEARREATEGILLPEQREALEQIRAESRAFQRGQRSGRRQAGMRGRVRDDSGRAFRRGPRAGADDFRRELRRQRGTGVREGLPGSS